MPSTILGAKQYRIDRSEGWGYGSASVCKGFQGLMIVSHTLNVSAFDMSENSWAPTQDSKPDITENRLVFHEKVSTVGQSRWSPRGI